MDGDHLPGRWGRRSGSRIEATVQSADEKFAAMDAIAARGHVVRLGIPTVLQAPDDAE